MGAEAVTRNEGEALSTSGDVRNDAGEPSTKYFISMGNEMTNEKRNQQDVTTDAIQEAWGKKGRSITLDETLALGAELQKRGVDTNDPKAVQTEAMRMAWEVPTSQQEEPPTGNAPSKSDEKLLQRVNEARRALMGLRAVAELLESHGQPDSVENYDLGKDFFPDLACLMGSISGYALERLDAAYEES